MVKRDNGKRMQRLRGRPVEVPKPRNAEGGAAGPPAPAPSMWGPTGAPERSEAGLLLDGSQLAHAMAQIAVRTVYAALSGDPEIVARMRERGKYTSEFAQVHRSEVPAEVRAFIERQFQVPGPITEAIASEMRIAFSGWELASHAEIPAPQRRLDSADAGTGTMMPPVVEEVRDLGRSAPIEETPATHESDVARWMDAQRYLITLRVLLPYLHAESSRQNMSTQASVQFPAGYPESHCSPLCTDPYP